MVAEVLRCGMTDTALRAILTEAVSKLLAATELTMDEIIGISALPPSMKTAEVCHSLGVLDGAAAALRATRREMLEDFDLMRPGPRA